MRWLAVASIAVAASLAHADPGDAAAAFERAKTSYAAGDFAAATAAFRTAFELDPKADYLFGWAQAIRKAGDCPAPHGSSQNGPAQNGSSQNAPNGSSQNASPRSSQTDSAQNGSSQNVPLASS